MLDYYDPIGTVQQLLDQCDAKISVLEKFIDEKIHGMPKLIDQVKATQTELTGLKKELAKKQKYILLLERQVEACRNKIRDVKIVLGTVTRF